MLRQFHGTPFEPDLRQAIAKLADMLPDNVTVRLDSIGDFLSVLPAVEAEYDPDAFCALLRAVVGQRQLDMVYWTASRNETTRRNFDPYELSLVDDGWYVFGYCHKAAEIRQFAVQRVRLVKETGETFDRPAQGAEGVAPATEQGEALKSPARKGGAQDLRKPRSLR